LEAEAVEVEAIGVEAVDEIAASTSLVANLSPGKLNVKTGPPLSLYFSFSILLVFSTL